MPEISIVQIIVSAISVVSSVISIGRLIYELYKKNISFFGNCTIEQHHGDLYGFLTKVL